MALVAFNLATGETKSMSDDTTPEFGLTWLYAVEHDRKEEFMEAVRNGYNFDAFPDVEHGETTMLCGDWATAIDVSHEEALVKMVKAKRMQVEILKAVTELKKFDARYHSPVDINKAIRRAVEDITTKIGDYNSK